MVPPVTAPDLEFKYQTKITRSGIGLNAHIVPVPDEVADRLKAARITRLVGALNGHPIRRALKGYADGGSFLIIGLTTLRGMGLSENAVVKVELRPDPNPDDLDIPDEFLIALEQNEEANTRWQSFTIGKQRSLVHYVASAKREETRIKRAIDMVSKIRTRTLHGD